MHDDQAHARDIRTVLLWIFLLGLVLAGLKIVDDRTGVVQRAGHRMLTALVRH